VGTEQDQKDRDQEQGEVVAKAVVAAVAAEVVLRQGRVGIVSAPTAVKKQPINWEAPVMSRNVQNAERL